MSDLPDSLSNLVLAGILLLPFASHQFWQAAPVDVALAYLFLLTIRVWGDFDG